MNVCMNIVWNEWRSIQWQIQTLRKGGRRGVAVIQTLRWGRGGVGGFNINFFWLQFRLKLRGGAFPWICHCNQSGDFVRGSSRGLIRVTLYEMTSCFHTCSKTKWHASVGLQMVYRWPLNRYKNGISEQRHKNLGRTFDFSEYLAGANLWEP